VVSLFLIICCFPIYGFYLLFLEVREEHASSGNGPLLFRGSPVEVKLSFLTSGSPLRARFSFFYDFRGWETFQGPTFFS